MSRREVSVASQTNWQLAWSTAVPLLDHVVAGGTECTVIKKPDRTLPKNNCVDRVEVHEFKYML